jgi:tetratricopeptide (TPR) repeat protein
MHDLLRAYAADRARHVESDEDRHAAVQRVLDHYLHTAYAADRLLYPARDAITLDPPRPGVEPAHPADHDAALAWFAAEHATLIAAVELAAAIGLAERTQQFVSTLSIFLIRRGFWHDWAAVARVGVAAAHGLADPKARARAHRSLADACTRLGDLDEAHTQYQRAVDLAVEADDVAGQAHAYADLASVWSRRQHNDRAVEQARRALLAYESIDHRLGQANMLNAIGWYHALLGEDGEALTHCRRALALHEELDNPFGQANTLDSLGYVHRHLGEHADAVACYQQAITLYREVADRYNEADTLVNLGDTLDASGARATAREAWRQALAILTDLGHPNAPKVRAKLDAL